MNISDLFGSQGSLTWWQECARATVIFAYGLVLVRLAGRRIFGKWAALDIIVSIVVGSNLSRALTGGAPFFGTLVATALLMAFHWVLSHAAARSSGLSRVLEGLAIELANNGMIDRGKLAKDAITDGDLKRRSARPGSAASPKRGSSCSSRAARSPY